MGIPLSVPNPISWTAAGTITKYDACVSNAEGTVIATNGNNDEGFVGFAQHAAISGEAVALSREGDITKARANGTSVTLQDYLVCYGASGEEGELKAASAPTTTTQHVVAQALEASTTTAQEIVVRQLSFYVFDQTA